MGALTQLTQWSFLNQLEVLTSRAWSCCLSIWPCGMVGWGLNPMGYCFSIPIMPGMFPCIPGIMPG